MVRIDEWCFKRSVTHLRAQQQIPQNQTITGEYEREYNCKCIFSDQGEWVKWIEFPSEQDEIFFRLKWQ